LRSVSKAFSENTGGTRNLLAQLENLVLRGGLPERRADRIPGPAKGLRLEHVLLELGVRSVPKAGVTALLLRTASPRRDLSEQGTLA